MNKVECLIYDSVGEGGRVKGEVYQKNKEFSQRMLSESEGE